MKLPQAWVVRNDYEADFFFVFPIDKLQEGCIDIKLYIRPSKASVSGALLRPFIGVLDSAPNAQSSYGIVADNCSIDVPKLILAAIAPMFFAVM